MLKQGGFSIAILSVCCFTLMSRVKAQTTIPVSAADNEIVQAQNFIFRRVLPTAANLEVITVR